MIEIVSLKFCKGEKGKFPVVELKRLNWFDEPKLEMLKVIEGKVP